MAKIIIETHNLGIGKALLALLADLEQDNIVVMALEPAQIATATQDATPAGMIPVAPGIAPTPALAHVPVVPLVVPAALDGELDANGMPWNGEYHAGTKLKKENGEWKVRKGCAEQAKAAIAAHKASGGNIAPPADLPPQTMPVTPAAPVAPVVAAPVGMPQAPAPVAPVDMPAPVTQSALEEKIMDMMSKEQFGADHSGYWGLLDKHGIDRADPTTPLTTNETLRAAFYADCVAMAGG